MSMAQLIAFPLGPFGLGATPANDAGGRDLSPLSDEALMFRWRDGDMDAFRTLYGRHRASLHRYVLRMTGAVAEAEEVFQEVWMGVVRSRDSWSPLATFRTWLFSIANRRLADRSRKRARRFGELFAVRVDDEAAPLPAAPEPDPAEAAHASQLGQALLAAITALPLDQREAFLMQAEGGLTLDEIAAASGVGRETVKSRLRYANQRLRRDLEAWR